MNIPPTLSSTLQAIKNGGCLLRGGKSHGLWVYANWTHNTFYAEFFRKIREREYAHCCLLSHFLLRCNCVPKRNETKRDGGEGEASSLE